jgi:hypothetical protein
MRGFGRLLIGLAASVACAAPIVSPARGADGAPVGFWRATNDCFLAVFLIGANGHAQTAYQSGEQDETGAWTWDGTTLKITSPMFPQDQFTAHVASDRVEAEYVWHDLERDQLNRQSCVFEHVDAQRLQVPGRNL